MLTLRAAPSQATTTATMLEGVARMEKNALVCFRAAPLVRMGSRAVNRQAVRRATTGRMGTA